jgi:hypothetical protein
MSHQPAALFPSWYLEPWTSQLPPDSEKSVEELADSDNHPGVTIEPTPSPVQAATVRAAAQGGSLTEAEMVAVLTEAGWPAELHTAALAVSWCESRWSSHGAGDISNHPEQMGRPLSRGLFQMGVSGYRWVNGAWTWWNGWFLYFGIDESMADDPVTNARTAWWAYQRSSWGPWTCAAKLGLR